MTNLSLSSRILHHVVDNFLPSDEFSAISTEQFSLHNDSPSRVWSKLSVGKSTTSPESSQYPSSYALISRLASTLFCEFVQSTLHLPHPPLPLSAFSDTCGHSYFHKMEYPSFLSSHVDRSYLIANDKIYLKVANAIVYLSPQWSIDYGGSTFLGKRGDKYIISYIPNRLFIFLHNSRSFHGVLPLSPSSPPRYTVYMDYYLPLSSLSLLNASKRFFWKHDTVYAFELQHASDYFSSRHYLFDYIRYNIRRFIPFRF